MAAAFVASSLLRSYFEEDLRLALGESVLELLRRRKSHLFATMLLKESDLENLKKQNLGDTQIELKNGGNKKSKNTTGS